MVFKHVLELYEVWGEGGERFVSQRAGYAPGSVFRDKGSLKHSFMYSHADATAVNEPSMARLRLALPSVARNCWKMNGILKSP